MRSLLFLAFPLMLACGCAGTAAKPRAGFSADMNGFIAALRQSPAAPPGSAVIVVHRGVTIFESASGVRDLSTGAPLTMDTPIYNASVTKSYTGLLAAMLDAERKLPLGATLSDIWPGQTLPPPLDPRAVTIAKLLSHSSEVREGGMVFRSVVTGEISARQVPAMLANHARPTGPGFTYDNFGPFVWSAMAEKVTGRTWHQLLQDRILTPLGHRHSASRTESIPAADIAHCHPRAAGRWHVAPPKATAVMNAAGGMFTSARDAGSWLKLFLTDGRSAGGRIPAALLRRTWQPVSVQSRNMWGLQRDGYGLGWDLGTYDGRRFVSRSGGFAGCRAISLFLPAEGLGIAVLTNGDAGANDYDAAIVKQAIDYFTNRPDAAARAAVRIREQDALGRRAVAQLDALASLESAAKIDPGLMRDAAGTYENARLGRFTLIPTPQGLRARAGVYQGVVAPQPNGKLRLVGPIDPAGDPIRFERSPAGRVTSFLIDDDRFDRVPSR